MTPITGWSLSARLQAQHRRFIADLSRFRHVYHLVDFENDTYDTIDTDPPQAARGQVSLESANVISSQIADHLDDPALHTIALDVDHLVRVVDSTTPGHHHLYIDVALSWEKYEKLLDALAEAGVVEVGYVTASKRRKATHLRLPWVMKTPNATLAPTEVEASED